MILTGGNKTKKVQQPMAEYNASDFERLGGSSRNYRNKITGEVISRRQFDTRYGRLKNTGLSYEKQAAQNKKLYPLQAAQRPRRGKQAPPTKDILRKIKRSAHAPKYSEKYRIGYLPIGFDAVALSQAFYALFNISRQTLYYLYANGFDEQSGVPQQFPVTKSYSRIPATSEQMQEVFDRANAQAKKYKVRITELILHYRFPVNG